MLTDVQISELQEGFELVKKGGKTITALDLQSILSSCSIFLTFKKSVELVDYLSADHVGISEDPQLDFVEFLAFLTHELGVFNNDHLLESLFDEFDINDNGYITQQDLLQVCESLEKIVLKC
eukprot:TRINITY_DN894_c0_g1_i2.p1 TRINITY_DN894_c0_g1~~TRINITY_DN894_c0_g1_i2.p1  ORF type:complete len:122 (-),score=27.05 TRINITY_DN894_c0_g1_i2:32-397(-)